MIDSKHTICPDRECGGIVVTVINTRVRCIKCKTEFQLSKQSSLIIDINKICVVCDKKYQHSNRSSKTCSDKCKIINDHRVRNNNKKKSRKKIKEQKHQQ